MPFKSNGQSLLNKRGKGSKERPYRNTQPEQKISMPITTPTSCILLPLASYRSQTDTTSKLASFDCMDHLQGQPCRTEHKTLFILFTHHIISYQYNDINFSNISPVLKGSSSSVLLPVKKVSASSKFFFFANVHTTHT